VIGFVALIVVVVVGVALVVAFGDVGDVVTHDDVVAGIVVGRTVIEVGLMEVVFQVVLVEVGVVGNCC